ncbi:hypothetical protein AA0111_g5039 [Alternaria arborescens]|uniref:hypothetical protein n=1 Tax=Alternaria arborescens TaxID=156630 RepID=UPI001074B7C1|nr:hypothetical protein AA0111_g5039 [Alternaria arborescens]RYO30801.1 hypothetical protein AA0111_g5039 [Alternaria arborescens]
MPGQYLQEDWKLINGATPILCFTTAVLYALYILSFPPTRRLYRILSIFILALPTWYAFRYSDQLCPHFLVNDTFARTCLIWFAHMSYEVCVVEFAPVLPKDKQDMGEQEQTKESIRQGYKVLFDRNHTQVLEQRQQHKSPTNPNGVSASKEKTGEEQYTATDKKTDEPILRSTRIQHGVVLPEKEGHGYSRWRFVGYHILKGFVYYGLQRLFDLYETRYSPLVLPPSAYMTPGLLEFFQQLPTSMDYQEITWRLEFTFDWCILSLWMYESYHSVFAVLYVGSGLDGPEEWSTGLFGPFSNAWSVRRYWSKHWHNYVYHSFSGHIKCVTRGWLGMKRGAVTRMVENTLVFFVSGLMHSLVRWQQNPSGDCWAITCYYVAQILPMIFEWCVATQWSKVRKLLGFRSDSRWLRSAEYAIGYLWVIAWFLFSVPKYYQTRMAWSNVKRLKTFIAELEAARALNETSTER